MDPNTHKNFMGAAGAGGEPAGPGQFMVQGMIGGAGVESGSGQVADSVDVDWTVPAGVTSICAVAIGGGEPGEKDNSDPDGGNAGDLRYVNDISVTPGETLTIRVANGFWGSKAMMTTGNAGFGNETYIEQGNTKIVYARGGDGSGTNVGTGEDGANGNDGSGSSAGGGGLAGGYSSNSQDSNGNNTSHVAQSGGGVGLTGNNEVISDGVGGPNTGGAYGGWACDNLGPYCGCFGGGGGGMNTDHTANFIHNNIYSSVGAPGAVRIIWGEGRSFPSNAQGYFPTPAAGTDLDIRLMYPMVYNRPTGSHAHAGSARCLLQGLQVIDDNGTNLWGYANATTANYLTVAVGGQTNRDNTPHTHSSLGTGASLGTYGKIGYNCSIHTNFDEADFKRVLIDTGSTSYKEELNIGPHKIGRTELLSDYSPSEWADDNENYYYNNFFCRFTNATVIKKIIFYINRYNSWIPRCKILMDGEVIADDYPVYRATNSDDGARYYDSSSGDNYLSRAAYFEFTD